VSHSSQAHLICGIATAISGDDEAALDALREQLALYPKIESAPSLTVALNRNHVSPAGLVNPSAHREYDDWFAADYGPVSVAYYLVDGRIRHASVTRTEGRFPAASVARKFVNIQFDSTVQRIGQIVHELVVVPAALLTPGLVPFHASAVTVAGRVLLIGGTGGVGKTTLASRACLRGAAFVADDIAVASVNGVAFPNLAYPKIYAYNVEQNHELRRRVLANRGVTDRVQWWLRRRLGAKMVRRAVSPSILSEAPNPTDSEIASYSLLVRDTSVSDISIRSVSADLAARFSAAVMTAEYASVTRHFQWRVANRIAAAQAPDIETIGELSARWYAEGSRALEKVKCEVILVPGNLSEDLQDRILAHILDHVGS
jgi:hypothetical protein